MMDSQPPFSDSNDNSAGSSICHNTETQTQTSPETSTPNLTALKLLSENLELVFQSSDFSFCSDAKIITHESSTIPIHRCILAARSPFFKTLFSKDPKVVKFELKELAKDFIVGRDSLTAVLAYLYSGKIRELPKGICVCVDEDCDHVGCRPAVSLMVQVLYASFSFQVVELVSLYQRHLLDIVDKVAADDILVILSVAKICEKTCERLLARCIEIVVKSDVDIITLQKELPPDVVKQITVLRSETGLVAEYSNRSPDIHVRRIHMALDSDDVELVRWLLKEGHTSLDDAYALHYAVAYCDAKTTTELLDLGIADVNLRNPRGQTVLHLAAMRKEPKIIVSLLTKGARLSDLTSDGRKALQISKRLTRSVDYNKSTEEGKPSQKDRLCVEILEQAERRDPLLGEASVSLAMAGDDLRMKLLYLENRALWWKRYGDSTPELQELVVSVLSATYSSTGCERNWSAFQQIHAKRRNHLEQQRMNALVYVKYNIKLEQMKKKRDKRGDAFDHVSLSYMESDDEWICEKEDPALPQDPSWMNVHEFFDEVESANSRSKKGKRKRVSLAKLLFPIEAKVAMDIAQVEGTLEFPLGVKPKNPSGSRRTSMDLNESPFKIEEERLNRMRALSRTVELGKRFFPRCSDVLNKIMDADDLSELAYLGEDNPEEHVVKKRRYMELQDILLKAFSEDKEEFDRATAMSSSSSSTSKVRNSNNRLLQPNKKR